MSEANNRAKLRFGTAGLPARLNKGDYRHAIPMLRNELDLDAIEVEFVYGARMKPAIAVELGEIARKFDVVLTVHGPYYINLNSLDIDKRTRSREHIIQSARLASMMGARSVTFHAAFYMKMQHEFVYGEVKTEMMRILDVLDSENIHIPLKPETTGKPSQWGNLDEILRLSSELPGIAPCIDFAHLFARTGGKFNTYAEVSSVLQKVSNSLGSEALSEMHMHVSGIEYTKAGERKHLVLEESCYDFRNLLKVLYDFGVGGSLICESPILEEDAMKLAEVYREIAG